MKVTLKDGYSFNALIGSFPLTFIVEVKENFQNIVSEMTKDNLEVITIDDDGQIHTYKEGYVFVKADCEMKDGKVVGTIHNRYLTAEEAKEKADRENMSKKKKSQLMQMAKEAAQTIDEEFIDSVRSLLPTLQELHDEKKFVGKGYRYLLPDGNICITKGNTNFADKKWGDMLVEFDSAVKEKTEKIEKEIKKSAETVKSGGAKKETAKTTNSSTNKIDVVKGGSKTPGSKENPIPYSLSTIYMTNFYYKFMGKTYLYTGKTGMKPFTPDKYPKEFKVV